MAFTPFTGTYSSGDLQYVINTLYSPKVEREYRANLVAGDFFDNLSGMFAGGGGHLSIPDIFTNQFTAQDKSTGSNVTEQSPAEAELTLTVDTWKEVSYVIEDRQLKQIMAGSDVLDAYASQAKYLIAKALDTSLMALYSGLSQTVNDTASDVTDADVRQAIESIVDGDVPMQRLAFFFHPTVSKLPPLTAMLIGKFCKLQGKLKKFICRQATAIKKAVEASTTIIRTPLVGEGMV